MLRSAAKRSYSAWRYCAFRPVLRTAAGSVLECHADKIALPPNHAALVDGVEIIERQFEIRGQDVKLLQPNSRATVCDVMDPAGEYAALRIKE